MNPKDQELMERYIYQVVRRLPKKQRHEVNLELQELISDMWETEQSMETVLTKLGDPREFAKQYQDDKHYLIGPEYFDTYLWFLKIVLLCAAVPILAVSVAEGIQEGMGLADSGIVQAVVTSAIYGIGKGIPNVIVSCIGIFGGITLMFAIMERNKVKFDLEKETEWNVRNLEDSRTGKKKIWTPNFLAPVPDKRAIISRGDSILGIVFIVIFCILLIFSPNFFSAIFKNGEKISTIPVFNLEQWHIILPVFILSLVIGLGDEIFRLIAGQYCKPVMISNIVCGALQIVLSFVVLKVFPFWNPNFTAELKLQAGEQISSSATFFIEKWNGDLASNLLFVFITVLTIVEIATTVYKTLRYGTDIKANKA